MLAVGASVSCLDIFLPTVLAVGAGVSCLDIFFSPLTYRLFSPSI